MANKLKIVDAHHHFFNLDDLRYHLFKLQIAGPNQLKIHLAGDLTPIRKNYKVEDLKEDAKDVELVKSVHLQAECADEVGEAKWLQSLADTQDYELKKPRLTHHQGFPQAIVAHADLRSPTLSTLLETYSKLPNVRGIRQLSNWDVNPDLRACDQDLLSDPNWVKGLHALAKHKYSYDIQVWHHQLKQASQIAASVPEVLFILNHTGQPIDRTPKTLEVWTEGIKELAKNTNVVAKISGLGMTDHNWTVESIRPYVLGTIEAFGVDRCMFASNFPIDKLLSNYTTLFKGFQEVLKDFSAEDQHKLFYSNACKYYRI